jgi:hypothetical protein
VTPPCSLYKTDLTDLTDFLAQFLLLSIHISRVFSF